MAHPACHGQWAIPQASSLCHRMDLECYRLDAMARQSCKRNERLLLKAPVGVDVSTAHLIAFAICPSCSCWGGTCRKFLLGDWKWKGKLLDVASVAGSSRYMVAHSASA